MQSNKTNYKITVQSLLISYAFCILGCLVIGSLFRLWLSFQLLEYVLGILLGGWGGSILILSMSYSIQRAVDRKPRGAQKYMFKHFLIRTLIMLSLLLLGVFWSMTVLFGIALGLFCVKLGGYGQPYIQCKFFNK